MTEDELEDIDARIPVRAEDGAMVSMIVTGTARKGFLEDAAAAEIPMSDGDAEAGEPDQEKYRGRLKSEFKGDSGEKEEE
jgi:hypothetical protein